MLDKQCVGMFPWQPPKFDFFSINPIILKKTSFIMFINQSKKCLHFLKMFITWPASYVYDLHVCILMNINKNLKQTC